MAYLIESEKVQDVFSSIDELEKLLTERISDLHDVKGGKQARHAYMYYRRILYVAKNNLVNNLTEVEEKEDSE